MRLRRASSHQQIDANDIEPRWKLPRVAAACAAVILLTVAIAGAFVQFGSIRGGGWSSTETQVVNSMAHACAQLQDSDQQLCLAYVAAVGEDKWDAAVAWRQQKPNSYSCSGIEADCLQDDMLSGEQGSSCRPLSEGAQCGDEAEQCKLGICGGLTAQPSSDQQQQQQEQGAQANSSQLGAASYASNSGTAAYQQAAENELEEFVEHQEKDFVWAKGSQNQYGTEEGDPSREDMARRLLGADQQKNSSKQGANQQKNKPEWPVMITTVNADNWRQRVPETFLATSHEYVRIFDYGDERKVHAWANVFKKLSYSPIIRIGGASQDKMTKVPGDDTWLALKKLKDHANARFIFGLPLFQRNAAALSKQIIDLAQKHLPGAVIGYELGNEPEFWPTGLGGYDKDGKWQKGFEAYAKHFHRVAQSLNPCSLGKKTLSGPGWGNVNTQPTKWLANILWTGKDCYLWETNVHYYPYIDNTTVDSKTLLSPDLKKFGMDKFYEYKRITDKAKVGLRISETNSLYGGGRAGLSDTLVGALWVLDSLCEFAAAGATGFHLHWGSGGWPDGTRGQPNTGIQTNFYWDYDGKKYEYKQLQAMRVDVSKLRPPVPWPSIHAPWYGYLFWTIAAHGGYGEQADTAMVGAQIESKQDCNANIKIWAFKADSGELRTALINKDKDNKCAVRVKIQQGQFCKKSELSRLLPGPKGIYSKGGITWQGQTYENGGHDGVLQGNKKVEWIDPKTFKDGKCGFEIQLPAASAALIISKP